MHLTEDQALQALDYAWIAYHLAYARTSFSQLHEEEDCLWYESSIGFLVFGDVVRARFPLATAERRVAEFVETLRHQPNHWLVMPTSQPPDLAERLLNAGTENLGHLFGMAMELSQMAPVPALPNGVEIRPANDDTSVREYARLYIHLFEAPTESWEENLVKAELEIFYSGHDPFHRYLAYENGRAIAAGATYQEDGVASLETLSTLPECRNRGIGAVLATQAFQQERLNGAKQAVVWSSPGARHLYGRMGFRELCTGNLLGF